MFRGLVLHTAMLLSYYISSGALGSPDPLLSPSMITLALHNTIILIITLKSIKFQPLNQLNNTVTLSLEALFVPCVLLASLAPSQLDFQKVLVPIVLLAHTLPTQECQDALLVPQVPVLEQLD